MKTRKKFTREGRKAVYKMIKKFLSANPSAGNCEIADYLNSEKVGHPNAPSWTEKHVGNFMYRSRQDQESTGGGVTVKNDRISLAEIVLSSNIDEQSKERLLKGLFS